MKIITDKQMMDFLLNGPKMKFSTALIGPDKIWRHLDINENNFGVKENAFDSISWRIPNYVWCIINNKRIKVIL